MRLSILLYSLIVVSSLAANEESKRIESYREAVEFSKTNSNHFVFWGEDTPSMRPYISGNNWLVIEVSPFDDLKVGDIIVYSINNKSIINTMICHRIISGDSSNGFTVKGDNNNEPDSVLITRELYIGKLIRLYKVSAN